MKRPFVLYFLGLFLVLMVLGGSCPVLAQGSSGKNIYEDKCAICHGSDGKGNGPAAGALSPRPTDFTNHAFWQGKASEKITEAIDNGKGTMPAVALNPGQIKAVIDYMSQAFK